MNKKVFFFFKSIDENNVNYFKLTFAKALKSYIISATSSKDYDCREHTLLSRKLLQDSR